MHKQNSSAVDFNINPFSDSRISNWSLRTVDARSEFTNAFEDFEEDKHVPQDWRDTSLHPSYTKVKAPLHIEFQKRLKETRLKYEDQFQRELRQLVDYQTTAYEAARMERHMCITTLWPPLHSVKEIENTEKLFFRNISKKERKRINYLLITDIQ